MDVCLFVDVLVHFRHCKSIDWFLCHVDRGLEWTKYLFPEKEGEYYYKIIRSRFSLKVYESVKCVNICCAKFGYPDKSETIGTLLKRLEKNGVWNTYV